MESLLHTWTFQYGKFSFLLQPLHQRLHRRLFRSDDIEPIIENALRQREDVVDIRWPRASCRVQVRSLFACPWKQWEFAFLLNSSLTPRYFLRYTFSRKFLYPFTEPVPRYRRSTIMALSRRWILLKWQRKLQQPSLSTARMEVVKYRDVGRLHIYRIVI